MSTVAARLREAMDDRGVDQQDVAAAIGVTQGAISLILVGKTRRSKHLPEIAAYLGVSYLWLIGQSGEKQGPEPQVQWPVHVMMSVAMPSERALTRMFEGLLSGLPEGATLTEQAQLLAQRLPIGFAQLRDVRPDLPASGRGGGLEIAPEARAKRRHEPAS